MLLSVDSARSAWNRRIKWTGALINPSFSTRGVGDPGSRSRWTSWLKGLHYKRYARLRSSNFPADLVRIALRLAVDVTTNDCSHKISCRDYVASIPLNCLSWVPSSSETENRAKAFSFLNTRSDFLTVAVVPAAARNGAENRRDTRIAGSFTRS